MELTINIKVSERFCEAIELLAAAISVKGKVAEATMPEAPVVVEEAPAVKEVAPEVPAIQEKGERVVEKLKEQLGAEVVSPVAITVEMMREKMQAILAKNPNYALDVKGCLKALGVERIGDLAEESYVAFYDKLNEIEKEIAA